MEEPKMITLVSNQSQRHKFAFAQTPESAAATSLVRDEL